MVRLMVGSLSPGRFRCMDRPPVISLTPLTMAQCPHCQDEGITTEAKIETAYSDAGPDAREYQVAVCDKHEWQDEVEETKCCCVGSCCC